MNLRTNKDGKSKKTREEGGDALFPCERHKNGGAAYSKKVQRGKKEFTEKGTVKTGNNDQRHELETDKMRGGGSQLKKGDGSCAGRAGGGRREKKLVERPSKSEYGEQSVN